VRIGWPSIARRLPAETLMFLASSQACEDHWPLANAPQITTILAMTSPVNGSTAEPYRGRRDGRALMTPQAGSNSLRLRRALHALGAFCSGMGDRARSSDPSASSGAIIAQVSAR